MLKQSIWGMLLMGIIGGSLACSGTERAATPTTVSSTPTVMSMQSAATITTSEDPQLGVILVGANGNTLYVFTRDERNKSNCSGGCAQTWPPHKTVGDPTAGEGVTASILGTITRADGSTQVTYNGRPLYCFANDEKPGDTNGQGVGGVWFVVSAAGDAVTTTD